MIQNKKILFLTRLYFPHIGGVEKHVAKLSDVLAAKGYMVTVVTEQHSNLLQVEKHEKVTIYRIPVSKNVFLKKFYIWKWILSHLTIFYDADIIHVHDVFYWILPFRLFLPFKKIFITFHGYEGYPVRLRWKISRKIAELSTNGNICVGDFMKKWYKTVPSSVIYGGVKLSNENKKQKTENNALSAVFFGRLDDQTGILEYIEAYKQIKAKYPEFKLTIVGEGNLLNKIPKEIKVFKFTDDIDRYIYENRFIFVSRYLSMVEALILKREVIAVYDNPIKKDYLQMSPYENYINIAKNRGEIVNVVLKSIKNGSNDAQIKAGYEWAKEQTWEKIANEYLALWKKDFS